MKKFVYLLSQTYVFPFWVFLVSISLATVALLLDKSQQQSRWLKLFVGSVFVLPLILYLLSVLNRIFLRPYWEFGKASTPMTFPSLVFGIVFIIVALATLILSNILWIVYLIRLLMMTSTNPKPDKKKLTIVIIQMILYFLLSFVLNIYVDVPTLLFFQYKGSEISIYSSMYRLRSDPTLPKQKQLESLFCDYIPIRGDGKSNVLTKEAARIFLRQYNKTYPNQKLTRERYNQTLRNTMCPLNSEAGLRTYPKMKLLKKK